MSARTYAVIGTGGVGGYYGARLADGAAVTDETETVTEFPAYG